MIYNFNICWAEKNSNILKYETIFCSDFTPNYEHFTQFFHEHTFIVKCNLI